MITIQILMKAVIQRRIVLNLDLNLKVNKMKICGVLEKLNKNHLSIYPFLFILFKPACIVSKFD